MILQRRDNDFGLRLAGLFICLFIVIGIQFPFFPLWLKGRGLDPEAIGIVLAIPIVMRVITVPLISRAVDRAGDLRRGLIAAAFAGAVGFTLVAFAHGFFPILLAVALASVAVGPLVPLADAYALKGLTARNRAYGPARLWGSVAFIAATLGTGALLAIITTDRLIWLMVAAFVLLGLSTLLLPPLDPTAATGPRIPGSHLWQSRKFLAIAIAAGLIQASHTLYYGFSVVDWTAKGMSGATIGLLWGLGVVAEIALFAYSGRIGLSPVALVALGAAGALIRWIVMATNPPLEVLALVQCLHGLSFGATHIGAVQFVARIAGERSAATAQGDFATLLAIAGALATSVCGLLYDALADYGYLIMAAMAALGGACLALARPTQA